jgi:amphi-Trp domain-containing protein
MSGAVFSLRILLIQVTSSETDFCVLVVIRTENYQCFLYRTGMRLAMKATIKKSVTGITKKKSVKSKIASATISGADSEAVVNKSAAPKLTSPQISETPPTKNLKTAKQSKSVNAGIQDMPDKSSDKKTKGKSAIKTKSKTEPKTKSKEDLQAEKLSKAEIKAIEKAASKAREIEKKAKKAAEKAKEMARDTSKKREKEHKKIKYERRMKREEAVTYFTSLIAGLEKGTVQFKQGKDTVVLNPCDLVDVEIKAETKGREEKVTFEISWLTTSAQDISISSS